MIQLLSSIMQGPTDKEVSDNLVDLVQGENQESGEQGSQNFLSILFGESEEQPVLNPKSGEVLKDPKLAQKNAEVMLKAQENGEVKEAVKNSPVLTLDAKKVATELNTEAAKQPVLKVNSAQDFVQSKSMMQASTQATQMDKNEIEKIQLNTDTKNIAKLIPVGYKNAVTQNESKLIDANKVLGSNEIHHKANQETVTLANADQELSAKLVSASPITEVFDSNLAESGDNFISKLEGLSKTSFEAKPQVNLTEAKAPSAFLNMSDLEKTPTQNLIEKISNYFEQEQVQKAEKIDLVVKHDELGKFNIQVNKAARGSELVDVRVQSMSPESQKFFQEHERELLQSMTKNGVKVGEFKLMAQADSPTSQDRQSDRHQSSKNFDFNNRQQQNEEQSDSQRRRAMWKYYQDGLAA